jgi:hypothetical protein
MLSIIRYIRENGLARAIEDFKLKARVYEDKIHLKYNQLESNMALEEVQDCRGLILEKDTWKIIAMSFRKFFNFGEGPAATIDWNTARVLEKVDGSMMEVYFDWHKSEWFAATTGTAEGEGEVNNKMGTTFNQLFWQTFRKYSADESYLTKGFTYVFELTTPYNIVVKPHGVDGITLLAVRNNESLVESNYKELLVIGKKINVPVVKSFDLNKGNFDELIKTFEGMPWSEEGYVVIDGNFNRVKIKNPAYCAVHHLKGKTAEHNILTIIKTNEIDEFAATFPDRREELYRLKAAYDALIEKLEKAWEVLDVKKSKDITAGEKKLYAEAVFEICKAEGLNEFSGLFFALQNEKAASVKEYMVRFDDKRLYKIL